MRKQFCTWAVCMTVLFSGCTSEPKSDCLDVIFETDILIKHIESKRIVNVITYISFEYHIQTIGFRF